MADRDEARPALGDPGPHLHRQGRRGDAAPRRRPRAVRLHGHAGRHLPLVRRPAGPRACPGAGAAVRAAGPLARGDGDLPARAALPAGAGRVPAPRQSDPVPGGPRRALQPPEGRGHRAGRVPRTCGRARDRRRAGGGRGRRCRAARRGTAPRGAGGRLWALPGVAGRSRRDRLRGPGPPGAHAPARAPGRPPADPGTLPVRPGRRVPGRQPGTGRAGGTPRGAAPQRHGGGRRRPVDLPVPRRGHGRDRGLPGPLPTGPDGGHAAQLPLARPDPRRVLPPDPFQRSRPPGGPAGDREAARRASPGRRLRAGPPARLRHGDRRGGLGGGRHRAPDPVGRASAGPRGAGAGQRRRRRDPSLAERGRDPVALLGRLRPLQPAGSAAPARVPPGDRGSAQLGGRLRARRVGALRLRGR